MAFKSPGIYFTEIDNTEYTNPTAEIGTTVAVIGFAKKGPIGEPIEINSYNDFKSIFGTPIAGTYAGLAVRSILSAGGTVLYVRIADESLASKSNVIIKNYSEGSEGALIINNKNAITVGSVINGKTFINGEVYASDVTDVKNDKTKTVMLRTPAVGRFTLTDIMEQFNEGLKDQRGFEEYSFRTPSVNGYKVFSAKSSAYESGTKDIGPYFVELERKEKPETLVEAINKVISRGTNPYQIFRFDSRFNFNSVNNAGNGISFEENITDAKITGVVDGTYKINNKKTNEEDLLSISVDIKSNDGTIMVSDLAVAIDNALVEKGTNIRCKFIYDKGIDDANDYGNIGTCGLLFFSTEYINFEILPFYNETNETYEKSLFAPSFKTLGNKLNSYVNLPYIISDDGTFSGDTKTKFTDKKVGFVFDVLGPNGTSFENNNIYFEAKYNEYTNSIIFEPVVKETEIENSTIKISNFDFKLDDYTVSNFEALFVNNDLIDNENSENGLYNNILALNKKAAGVYIREYTGQKGLKDVFVIRGDDQRIYIKQRNDTETPIIKENIDFANTLNDLFGPLTTEKEFEERKYSEGKDVVLLKKEGSFATNAINEDMIIFTAKEYGAGTNNIGIEIFTSVSPIDESSNAHYIDIYVDGIRKEGWEDVSYNPEDDNYFVKLINDAPENGGSAYVNVEVKRGNKLTGEVKVPDTISLNSSGIIYLGTAIDSKSVKFEDSSAETNTEYEYYDYKLGNNGMPSGDPSDLFLNAMNAETSGLSNKDLYSWHVLITPDDGQREEIQDEAIKLCEFMEDAIYIADPPQGLSRDGVINWHNGASQQRTTPLQSNYCCTYWPWVKVYNAIESKYQYVQPSIIMAAQFCKVDNSYAPWYAPAGSTNGYCSTALDLEVNSKDKRYPNKTDRDKLYLDQNRINPFLKLRNGNILAYGEKTCQRKNSTLTKIHTRRMLIALKKDLNSAIKGFIFQPTVGENINKIRNNVTTIMESYKTGGAVESYVVDTSMNTTETLQQDILYIAISCVPVGCIEQVEITFTLNKSAD